MQPRRNGAAALTVPDDQVQPVGAGAIVKGGFNTMCVAVASAGLARPSAHVSSLVA